MQITVVPNDDFLHDDIRFRRGVAAQLEDHIAHEFERRGLVRIVLPETGVVPNAPGDGLEGPPSSLPADPPLPERPVLKLKRPASETKDLE